MPGKRIRLIRLLRGLDQKYLAAEVGVDKSTLSRYENGHVVPPWRILVRMARVLRCSLDHFVDDGRDHVPLPPPFDPTAPTNN